MSRLAEPAGPWYEAYERAARDALSVPLFRYLACGARESLTRDEAAQAWRDWRFLPRVMHDVTDVDLGVRLLGQEYAAPVGVAPTTLQSAVHPDGDVGMVTAAGAARLPVVVSSNTGTRFADLAATGFPWLLQAYLPADRTLAEPMLAEAARCGASGVVLTVDTPVVGTKFHGNEPTVWETVPPEAVRTNFDPDHAGRPGAEKATDLGPHDIGWLADVSGLPVVVKGVLQPQDAARAIGAGARAVWVSNHGGRQLDRSLATAHALAAVAAEVAQADEHAEVYVDGGVRCGLDAATGLALGADAVFLGRGPLYALAAGGRDGVAEMLDTLVQEFREAMLLLGAASVEALDDTLVRPRPGL